MTSLNDAPTFSYGYTWFNITGNATTSETSSSALALVPPREYRYTWVSNVRAGPADEAWQTLQFFVTPNDTEAAAARFASGPTIDAVSGQIVFSIRAAALFEASSTLFYVTLRDNGGTANGGNDTSATVPIFIRVVLPPAVPAAAASFPVWAVILGLGLAGVFFIIRWSGGAGAREPFVLK